MSRSSKKWVSEQNRDPYVKRARQEHFRSRASFKLIQVQEKFQVMQPGDWVVDLGASPGGWSQAAARIVGKKGRIVAVDLLPMDPIPGVQFLQGDVTEDETLKKLCLEFRERKADLVISDMAPNTSGISSLDHDRSILLIESVFDLLPLLLRPGGSLAVKVFQGKSFKDLIGRGQSLFNIGKVFKPQASRSKSVEVYWIGMDYRGNG